MNDKNNLDDNKLKSKLEIRKLKAELKHLNKNYFCRVILPVLIPSLITTIGTIGSIYVLYRGFMSSENEKRLQNITVSNENILKNNKLVLETYELTKQKDSLVLRKRQINDSITILSQEINKKNTENKELKELNISLKNEVLKIPDTVAKNLLTKYIGDIDEQEDFYYTKNPKSYVKFGRIVNKASKKIYDKIIDSYIHDEKIAWQKRMYVIMVAYNFSNDKQYLLNLFQQNLDSEICPKIRNSEYFYKVITCKEWDDITYHKNITYIIKKGIEQSCKNINTFKLINNGRVDPKLSGRGDIESFLLFLNIYKSLILTKESQINISNLTLVTNTEYISTNARKACFGKYIIENKLAFNQFLEKIRDEKDRANLFSTKRRIKNICDDFGITEQDFYSISFWNDIEEKNKDLLSRILEDGFIKYKSDNQILINDTYGK